MPSKTKKQQKFFKWIKAVQEGKAKGQGKIKELADSMSKKDVKDFADYLEESNSDMDMEKTSDQNLNKLLVYAGLSSLVGSGVAGMYGLSKYYADNFTRPKKINKIQEDISKAVGEGHTDEEEVLVDENPDMYVVDQDAEDKISSMHKAATGELTAQALMYGAATPIAMIAPALLAYHFTKKFIDRNRNKNLAKELEDAKQEFESILSVEKQSALQQEVDALFEFSKKAEIEQNIIEPSIGMQPGTYDASGKPINVEHGFSLNGPGLVFAGGALAGLGGLGAYMLLSKKFKKNVETEKVKALERILKKNLTAEALENALTIKETPEGKKVIDLG